jgi:hypothetical protein
MGDELGLVNLGTGTEAIPPNFLWEIFAIMRKIPADVSALRIPS